MIRIAAKLAEVKVAFFAAPASLARKENNTTTPITEHLTPGFHVV